MHLLNVATPHVRRRNAVTSALSPWRSQRFAASPIALNTNVQIKPKKNPPSPSAKVTLHTPYQPDSAMPLIEITLPERKLSVDTPNPRPKPISVEYFNTVSAAFR